MYELTEKSLLSKQVYVGKCRSLHNKSEILVQNFHMLKIKYDLTSIMFTHCLRNFRPS